MPKQWIPSSQRINTSGDRLIISDGAYQAVVRGARLVILHDVQSGSRMPVGAESADIIFRRLMLALRDKLEAERLELSDYVDSQLQQAQDEARTNLTSAHYPKYEAKVQVWKEIAEHLEMRSESDEA